MSPCFIKKAYAGKEAELPIRLLSAVTLIAVLLLFGSGARAFADEASVTNNVSVSANTGGNVAPGVHNGTATVSVHIEGSVNGTAEPPVDLSTTSPSGQASVNIENHISGGNPASSSHRVSVSTRPSDPEVHSSSMTTTASKPIPKTSSSESGNPTSTAIATSNVSAHIATSSTSTTQIILANIGSLFMTVKNAVVSFFKFI